MGTVNPNWSWGITLYGRVNGCGIVEASIAYGMCLRLPPTNCILGLPHVIGGYA